MTETSDRPYDCHRTTSTPNASNRAAAAKVVTVHNVKGGCAKTTVSVHLADYLHRQGAKTLLIDSDPQGSARDWAAARSDVPRFSIIGIDRPTLHREVPLLQPDYDWIVIDTPGRSADIARSAIAIADLVVIPIQPSPYDVWAAQETVDLVREMSILKPTQKVVFAVNRKIANTSIGREISETVWGLYGYPVLKTAIVQRVIFSESAAVGMTVYEIDPKSSAAFEFDLMAKEAIDAIVYRINEIPPS